MKPKRFVAWEVGIIGVINYPLHDSNLFLIRRYYDGDDGTPIFFKTSILGKHFCFRQRLNNFTKIGNKTEVMFLSKTWVLSGSVALVKSVFEASGNFSRRGGRGEREREKIKINKSEMRRN